MRAAGWSAIPKLDEETGTHDYYWVKDSVWLPTYVPSAYCWDSNAWGNNRAIQVEHGLFNLPHILS